MVELQVAPQAHEYVYIFVIAHCSEFEALCSVLRIEAKLVARHSDIEVTDPPDRNFDFAKFLRRIGAGRLVVKEDLE